MRIHRGWLVAVLSMSIGLGATACKKAEEAKPATGDKTTEVKPGDKAVTTDTKAEATDPGGAKPPVAISQATGDDLSLLPVGSELVMGINFQQLQSSALWKAFVEPQLMKNMDEFEKFKAKCGFNPLESVKSVALGLSNVGPNSKPDGAMVIHGLAKGKVNECLDKMKDEIAAKGSEMTRDGDVILTKSKDGTTSAMTFVNDNTLLIALNGNKDTLLKLAKGDEALKTSKQFVDMFGKINTSDTVWGLMNGNSKLFAPAAQANIKFKAVFGSVNVTDGIALDGRARMDSADQATAFVTMASGKAAQVKGMVDKLDITGDGADVKVVVAISQEKLKSLMALMGGMGGMGGGAGGP